MKHLLLISLFFSAAVAFSQQSYKIFIDTTNKKIYYNKHLPVYFWISTSNNNTGQDVLLKPKIAKYANPYFFDTEGINTFRVKNPKNLRGYKEAIFQIWADGKPPELTYELIGPYIYKNNQHIIGLKTKIHLTGYDGVSGVGQIYYAIDSYDFQLFTRPFTINDFGTHKIRFYGFDKVGNKTDTLEKILFVDNKPPILNIETINASSDSILGPLSQIKIIATDKHSGVKAIFYKFENSSQYILYTHPIYLNRLRQKNNLLYYYAIDKLDNQSQVFTISFKIDKTAPKVDYQFLGDTYKKAGLTYVSPNTRIKILATDDSPIDKIFYFINGKKYIYKGIVDLSDFKGLVQMKIQAVDIAGNTSLQKNIRFFVDYLPPNTTILFDDPKFFDRDTLFITSKTKILFKASDFNTEVSQILYSIDNKNFIKYQKPFTLQKEGEHIIYFKSIDKVNNIENEKSKIIYVDNTPPKIEIVFSVEPYATEQINGENISVYPDQLKIYLAAVDDKTGERKLYYSLNNSKSSLYQRPIYLRVNKRTVFTLKVESTDALGNKSQQRVTFIMRPK